MSNTLPIPRWWISFCDPDKPPGSQFLGLLIVRGVDMMQALKIAHIMGINPGGQAKGSKIDEPRAARLSFDLDDFEGRLIDKQEAQDLANRIASEIGAAIDS